MTRQELFNHYKHYGVIEKRDDFEFNDDNIFASMFVITCDNITRLFILRNGEVVHTEILPRA